MISESPEPNSDQSGNAQSWLHPELAYVKLTKILKFGYVKVTRPMVSSYNYEPKNMFTKLKSQLPNIKPDKSQQYFY